MTRSARVEASDAGPEEERKAEPAAAALDVITGLEDPDALKAEVGRRASGFTKHNADAGCSGSPRCTFIESTHASRQAAIMRAAAAA